MLAFSNTRASQGYVIFSFNSEATFRQSLVQINWKHDDNNSNNDYKNDNGNSSNRYKNILMIILRWELTKSYHLDL